MLCAAIHPEEPGDVYIDDGLHYEMSQIHRVIVTEPMDKHAKRGEWWWANQVPDGIDIEKR
jgi:hypothetical protein